MGARLVVATDRTSNGPHLVYPSAASSGGDAEQRELGARQLRLGSRTPGESMLSTAEAGRRRRAASRSGARRARGAALRAVPGCARGRPRLPARVDGADRRRQPAQAGRDRGGLGRTADRLREGLEALEAGRGGRRRQLRHADPSGRRLRGDGRHDPGAGAGAGRRRPGGADSARPAFARVEPGAMPKAPVPAARRRSPTPGSTFEDIDRDQDAQPVRRQRLWFAARDSAVDARGDESVSAAASIYGHPQGPTGARGIVELMRALHAAAAASACSRAARPATPERRRSWRSAEPS